ncbi:MAG: hypothetical protein JW830_09935 [Bacteroidales bacterium]|nr:hypothetical protein [Bacteroidales bacterium]
MLDKLLELVKENAGDAIINNPAIPNSKNDAAIKAATASLFKALQGTAKTGGLNSIKDLFQTGDNVASSPVVKQVSSNVAGDLMKKFGLDKAAAGSIVSLLIPIVLSKLVKKTNDPNDNNFNLDGIIGALAGGKAGGLLGTLKGLLGR